MHEIIMNSCEYATAILNMISYLPQIIKILKTRHADDISASSWVLWTHSVVLWALYAILVENIGIIIAHVLSLALTVALFRFISKHRHIQK